MKSISSVLASFALLASPAFAQAPAQDRKPTCKEMMADKECEHKCCEKDEDGNMVCKMMDHSKMDHSKMDHSKMDHSKMDHSKMDHSKMDHSKMDHSKMDHSKMDHSKKDGAETSSHSHD